MLRIKALRGPQGDRYQATIELISEMVRVGPINGKIVIRTNDPDFPEIAVPVSAFIMDR